MSNYISIGNSAVSFDDLKNISNDDKIRIMHAMFDGVGLDTDNNGQIIQHTNLMYADQERLTIIPLAIDPVNNFDADAPDPYEDEEETEEFETVSDDFILEDTSLPPTLRPEQMMGYQQQTG